MSVTPWILAMTMPHVLIHWVPSSAHATMDSQEMDRLVKVMLSVCYLYISLKINYLSDINECDSIRPCHISATCTDTLGSFICTCNNGFTGDGVTCQSNNICVTYTYF